MSDENHSLEELRQKARFLRKEKQRIIKAKREQETIKRLRAEIDALQSPKSESRTQEELLKLGTKSLKNGINALTNAGKIFLNTSSKTQKTPIEKDLEQAQISGLWPNDETFNSQDILTPNSTKIEQEWENEKLRLKEEKTVKAQITAEAAQKTEKHVNEGCLAVLGTLAWFIPILWPIAIFQLFKTYPTTCFTLLGVFVFLIIIFSASHS